MDRGACWAAVHGVTESDATEGTERTAHTCGITIPWPGIEPAPPALQGGFLTTGRPENPVYSFLKIHVGGEGLGRQEEKG